MLQGKDTKILLEGVKKGHYTLSSLLKAKESALRNPEHDPDWLTSLNEAIFILSQGNEPLKGAIL